MTVPLLDPARESADRRNEIEAALLRVARSGRYILGPEVEQFESEIAEYLDVRHAIGCASGTDALSLAFRSIEPAKQRVIVTTPFTFFATASAAAMAGAAVRLVDIQDRSMNIDPTALAGELDHLTARDGDKQLIVAPVHIFGYACDMNEISKEAERVGAAVIEDAAQAMGTSYDGHAAGTIGDVGCFSFFPSKNLACMGDGGLIATNDDDLAMTCTLLRQHGSSRKYHHEILGTNSRLDAMQAAILRIRLKYLDADLERRRDHAAFYSANLGALPRVRVPVEEEPRTHSYHQYTIRVAAEQRDSLREQLTANGIATAIYYPVPLHLQEALADLGYSKGDFPVSEQASAEVISLPVFPEMTDAERQRVVEVISDHLA